MAHLQRHVALLVRVLLQVCFIAIANAGGRTTNEDCSDDTQLVKDSGSCNGSGSETPSQTDTQNTLLPHERQCRDDFRLTGLVHFATTGPLLRIYPLDPNVACVDTFQDLTMQVFVNGVEVTAAGVELDGVSHEAQNIGVCYPHSATPVTIAESPCDQWLHSEFHFSIDPRLLLVGNNNFTALILDSDDGECIGSLGGKGYAFETEMQEFQVRSWLPLSLGSMASPSAALRALLRDDGRSHLQPVMRQLGVSCVDHLAMLHRLPSVVLNSVHEYYANSHATARPVLEDANWISQQASRLANERKLQATKTPSRTTTPTQQLLELYGLSERSRIRLDKVRHEITKWLDRVSSESANSYNWDAKVETGADNIWPGWDRKSTPSIHTPSGQHIFQPKHNRYHFEHATRWLICEFHGGLSNLRLLLLHCVLRAMLSDRAVVLKYCQPQLPKGALADLTTLFQIPFSIDAPQWVLQAAGHPNTPRVQWGESVPMSGLGDPAGTAFAAEIICGDVVTGLAPVAVITGAFLCGSFEYLRNERVSDWLFGTFGANPFGLLSQAILQPHHDVAEAAVGIYREHLQGFITVGVHVRRGRLTDDMYFPDNTSAEAVLAMYKQCLIAAVDVPLSDERLRVYVASDNERIANLFLSDRDIGDKVILQGVTVANPLHQADNAHHNHAVLDQTMLSLTQAFVGTVSSTFSEAVIRHNLGQKRVVMLDGHRHGRCHVVHQAELEVFAQNDLAAAARLRHKAAGNAADGNLDSELEMESEFDDDELALASKRPPWSALHDVYEPWNSTALPKWASHKAFPSMQRILLSALERCGAVSRSTVTVTTQLLRRYLRLFSNIVVV